MHSKTIAEALVDAYPSCGCAAHAAGASCEPSAPPTAAAPNDLKREGHDGRGEQYER